MTGKGHAGQMIDLLGDGRVTRRGTGRAAPLARPDVQGADGAGGSPRSSGWPATSRAGEKLVVVLGDNVFERSQAEAIGAWASPTTAR